VQSRRDQVQAQSYVLGRLTSALISGDGERAENPNRRTAVGTLCGVLVAALVVAGFGVYGFVRPGGATAWRKPGVLVMERETGSRYVFADGQLRPVLNYASVRLLFGEDPRRVSVSSRSLRDVPRGLPVGVAGAPDALPESGRLANAFWIACTVAARNAGGYLASDVSLALTTASAGLGLGDRAVVVRPVRADGAPVSDYLLWRGKRYRLGHQWLLRVFGDDRPTEPVDPRWLDLVPASVDIDPDVVPGIGEPGPDIAGRATRVGQLFVVRIAGAKDRYYVLLRDGLSPLTATGYAILAADPRTAAAYGGGRVDPVIAGPAVLGQTSASKRRVFTDALPPVPPALAERGSGQTWCVRQASGRGVELVTATPVAERPSAAGERGSTAGAVRIQAGVGGLARAGRPGRAAGQGTYLITDAGLRYPVASAEVAEALGYPPASAVVITPELLDLLPQGAVLDSPQ